MSFFFQNAEMSSKEKRLLKLGQNARARSIEGQGFNAGSRCF
jgi:hypothetical protein